MLSRREKSMRFIQTFLIVVLCFSVKAYAVDQNKQPASHQTTEEILAIAHGEKSTDCATKIFEKALKEKDTDPAMEDADEQAVRFWARETMQDANVLEQIIECPEIKSVEDDTTINFSGVNYTFENGRTITANYSTQPKVIKQRILLSRKRSLPNGNANPKLMDPDDPAKYLNTEPAWYGIMVVQHDALKNFVGPGKNNTVSMRYINDYIDDIYPHGYWCTSKSALAPDRDTINQVVHEVVDLEEDTNDYYVAGDVNLEWIMYAEIAADIIISVATMGGGAVINGSLKGLRATKTGIRLAKNLGKFKRFARVEKYIQTSSKIERLEDYSSAMKNLEKARKRGKDVAKYEKELKDIGDTLKRIDPSITDDVLRNSDNIAKEIEQAQKTLNEITDVSKEVKEKKKALKAAKKAADSEEVKKYNKALHELDALRDKQQSMTTINRMKNPEKKAKAMEKYEKNQKRMKELQDSISEMERSPSLSDYAKAKNELDELQSVEKYMDASKQLEEVFAYHRKLKAFTRPQTGNIVARSLKKTGAAIKSFRATKDGAWMMTKAKWTATAGMSSRSAQIGYWLFDATLKHGSRLARLESKLGALYGGVVALQILGDMYDRTSSTSDEFTNGIEFRPLCLLSADDLKGQENVVNYGMWFMWMGNSTDPADDDAAYLQAMDFASKFFYQLDEFQDEHGTDCNVDIYVVRPFIRLDETNPNDPNGELFYLFMNEIPWTTAPQFSNQIKNIAEWDMAQSKLEQEDPHGKYRKQDDDNKTEDEDIDYDAEYGLDEIDDDENDAE